MGLRALCDRFDLSHCICSSALGQMALDSDHACTIPQFSDCDRSSTKWKCYVAEACIFNGWACLRQLHKFCTVFTTRRKLSTKPSSTDAMAAGGGMASKSLGRWPWAVARWTHTVPFACGMPWSGDPRSFLCAAVVYLQFPESLC